ncbi:hypothetical protein ACIA8G_23230 [Lentzea sp. NPDC051213]|uniref:hypothetical protein n=1 Tax=Lentzea sp. NPDC051213 TaxID=3364126 RepID=UPI0037A93260
MRNLLIGMVVGAATMAATTLAVMPAQADGSVTKMESMHQGDLRPIKLTTPVALTPLKTAPVPSRCSGKASARKSIRPHRGSATKYSARKAAKRPVPRCLRTAPWSR